MPSTLDAILGLSKSDAIAPSPHFFGNSARHQANFSAWVKTALITTSQAASV
jgi:hypothetical protein